ncbi:MAG: HipA N-terminal domain-containing protein [Candidatus Dormibacteria bacterium]
MSPHERPVAFDSVWHARRRPADPGARRHTDAGVPAGDRRPAARSTPLISGALPVRSVPCRGDSVRAFCDGLLPERPVRERPAGRVGLSNSNTFRLLEAFGRDCVGALHWSRRPRRSLPRPRPRSKGSTKPSSPPGWSLLPASPWLTPWRPTSGSASPTPRKGPVPERPQARQQPEAVK